MILNFDSQFKKAATLLDGVSFVYDKRDTTRSQFNEARGIVVRLGTPLDKAYLSKFSRLQFIATVTTGTDHIDEAYCREKNIALISLKGETTFLQTIRATPEHTWGLLLALVRKVPHAFMAVCSGTWDRTLFFGNELYGKCLGIVGFGRVGEIFASYACAFGMEVIAFDKKTITGKENPVRQVSFDELLERADIVSIALSLNETTTRFMGEKQFQKMKNTAFFINTARGALVDEESLLYALKAGGIAGAALDVLEGENIFGKCLANHPLVTYAKNHDNLILSPHIAGSTFESMERTALFIAKKIDSFLKAPKC